MYELLKLFFDICLFKKGPEDIPGSNFLLGFLILIYSSVSFLVLSLNSETFDAALQVVVEVVLILSLSWIILFVTNKRIRFQQTACALMGTDTIISFFALPAMATLIGLGSSSAFIFVVLLMIWHWVVSGHIFSHALEQPIGFGLGIAFLYLLTSYQIIGFLFFAQT